MSHNIINFTGQFTIYWTDDSNHTNEYIKFSEFWPCVLLTLYMGANYVYKQDIYIYIPNKFAFAFYLIFPTEMAQVVEILKLGTYLNDLIPWLLMLWRHKEPGHQQL